jgi:orotate phosphoribosyltransferase
MIYNSEIAEKVAEFLLSSKAVKLQPDKPFTWASGMKSPIYCDNRITLSFPAIRTYIRQGLTKLIESEFNGTEVIAGVATAGIPQGVLVAQDMGLPFVYVRSSPKGHGMENLIEGKLDEGAKVVVIEDLISTGGSSLKAVKALRDAGAEVVGLVSIFTYGFDTAVENFAKEKCNFRSLCDYNTLINIALEQGYYINKSDIENLNQWRNKPEAWGV